MSAGGLGLTGNTGVAAMAGMEGECGKSASPRDIEAPDEAQDAATPGARNPGSDFRQE
jgi:hypothetical protein